MRKIFDIKIISEYIVSIDQSEFLKDLLDYIFLIQYEKGELITSPSQNEHFFQIVAEGALNIYFVRDDGSVYSLSNGQSNYILGDMDLFSANNNSVYAEATANTTCISISLNQHKEQLLYNNSFLQMICRSLTQKMEIITNLDASPATLPERVLTYMKFKCESNTVKGLEKAAFHLNCSPRQLQRIMNQLISDGQVEKIGKGSYRLLSK
ncbi:MAG: cyclic nucleotide-binding domain-containing protein [Lachnospiraceae bacterium]|nr:cyclic nucleotide-binding domain-containing protein [Lachnospiraceae bacterium]